MGHVHAELMRQYAEDAKHLSIPYALWESRNKPGDTWRTLQDHPLWDCCVEYRRKECTFEPHPHQQLMQQYAEDAATCEHPWKIWQWKDQYGWNALEDTPRWNRRIQFRTKPRAKEIEINGTTISVEILNPEDIKMGTPYYIPSLSNPLSPLSYRWENVIFDLNALRRGCLFINREDAISYAKALIDAQT